MSAFERLGMRVGLVISEEEIRDAFRTKAAEVHPDSGGNEEEFAALQVAQEVMLSPARRLREWLSANGIAADERGTIAGEMVDLFQKVAETGAKAEAAIKAGEKAQSALAKGMAEVRLMGEREGVKDLLARIESEIRVRAQVFSEIEEARRDAAIVMRDLVFLEKWRGAMKSLYGRLM
jgi:curved DNA-binding protein CbpA